MKSVSFLKGLILLAIVTGVSCTKLDEKLYDRVSAENFGNSETELLSLVGPAYSSLGSENRDGLDNDYFFLQEASTDEIIVPTRGTDWDDNGQWRELWLHTWTPSHNPINAAWGFCSYGIGQINRIEAQLNSSTVEVPIKPQLLAELKALRALYHWMMMDLYGNVPIVSDFQTDPNEVTNKPRAEVFAFVESQLKEAIPLLSTQVGTSTYGRMTKYAAFTLLAKLYLNAQVYTGAARYADCITACDSVINSAKYTLNNNFFANFTINNDQTAEEIIFAVPTDKSLYGPGDFSGLTRMQLRTLHYSHRAVYNLGETPWNGFSSNADFYNKFNDPNDVRKTMFLVGQQYDNLGNPLTDGATPIILTPNVTSLSAAGRNEGARSVKYAPEKNSRRQQSNDWVFFRYADVLMMKAEALARQANNWNAGLTLVNEVRVRAQAAPLSSLTADSFLDERAREFAWEGWRRNDLIRFGKFGQTKQFKASVSPEFRNLYPIPRPRIEANPNLTQNPGY
jgi:starch-binding outer membrane protein, SusD/RagB family